jgi:hypothetical protein
VVYCRICRTNKKIFSGIKKIACPKGVRISEFRTLVWLMTRDLIDRPKPNNNVPRVISEDVEAIAPSYGVGSSVSPITM